MFGGVVVKICEIMLLCEVVGFDVILVEIVGIGQLEMIVVDMVDFFFVFMLLGVGDELQGIKKGVLEIVDMIVVNKVDGDGEMWVCSVVFDYCVVLYIFVFKLFNWSFLVIIILGLFNKGFDYFWEQVYVYCECMQVSGEWYKKWVD